MLSLKPIGVVDGVSQARPRDSKLYSVEGTIQRVDYRNSTVRVIAQGHPWEFRLGANCKLWLNGRMAPFRCFQPLDHVRVFYRDGGCVSLVEALYLWAEEPLLARSKRGWASEEMDVA